MMRGITSAGYGGLAMRTTLAIDDDILAAARHLADKEHKSIGEVISTLARQGLSKGPRSAKPVRNGVPLLAAGASGSPITLELVNQLRDEQA
jgi:hypothetical protein